jgi:hypothetical protein
MIRRTVMVFLSSISILGYGAAPVRRASYALPATVGDISQDSFAPLRYRVILSEPVVCTDTAITLELEVENSSNRQILIDPRGLLYQVTISGDASGSSSVGDLMDNPKSTDYVALGPHESYRKTVNYPLVKVALFSREGLYSLRLTYGQFAVPSPKSLNLFRGSVKSNVVLFRLKACSREER